MLGEASKDGSKEGLRWERIRMRTERKVAEAENKDVDKEDSSEDAKHE
jgi:hypothetical protein